MARVLVVCEACHRPQFSGPPTCVSCAAPLPAASSAAEVRDAVRSGRDQLLEAYDPFLEATLGRGQRLTLSERRLEWHPGASGRSLRIELSKTARVWLDRRPVYEALLFAALFGGLAPWVPWGWARGLLIAGAVLSVGACVFQRRYALRVEPLVEAREPNGVLLGIGSPRSALAQRVESVWETVQRELVRLGVKAS